MARLSYVGAGSSFRRILNHSPALSKAYWELRAALNDGVVPPRIRMLSFLTVDITDHCRY